VWKLDRLGRSVKDVLTIADDLHSRGIGLRILTGRLAGTYTPTGEGKFFFTMMAAFGELERDMLQERTFAGLAAAREHGRVGGRPTVMGRTLWPPPAPAEPTDRHPPKSPKPSASREPPSTATSTLRSDPSQAVTLHFVGRSRVLARVCRFCR